MTKTLNQDGPWEYLPVLNECIKILLTIAIGMVMGHFKIFQAKSFVPKATRFVFYVALPLLVFKGIGVGTDFYDDSFLWRFIFAFLILRVIALVVSLGIVFFNRDRTKGIGSIAVNWLALSWISTVILGVPISGAVFDDPDKGKTYGILAGISSFIFQLPLQLFILECHSLEQEYLQSQRSQAMNDEEDQVSTPDDKFASESSKEETPIEECAPAKITKPKQQLSGEAIAIVPVSGWVEFARRKDIWKRIFFQIFRNPVLWGITGGFVLSLSTIGPRFLNPTSPDFVPGLMWFVTTTGWLGDCVSPISLFAMGVWMESKGKNLFQISVLSATLFMLSKLVIVPLVMVGLAKAFSLDDEAGRAAVLIASLPISMASFSLASRYKTGEAILSENVALGVSLVLPTVLMWNLVMDAMDLFPITSK